MLAQDRRQHKRNRRLVTATLRFGNSRCEAVSLDVSAGGGYFYSNIAPPTGVDVVLEVKESPSSNEVIEVCSHVVRGDSGTTGTGRSHGFGVQWRHITSSLGEAQVRKALEKVFGIERIEASFRNPHFTTVNTTANPNNTSQHTYSRSATTTTSTDSRNRTESPFSVRRHLTDGTASPSSSSPSEKMQSSYSVSGATQTKETKSGAAEPKRPLVTPRSHPPDQFAAPTTPSSSIKQESRVLTVPTNPGHKHESRIFAAPSTSTSTVHLTLTESEEFGFGSHNGTNVTTPLPYVSWNSDVFRIGAPVRIVSGAQVAIGRVDSSDSPERIHVVLEGKPLRAGSELSIAAPAKVRGRICAHEVRAQVMESTIGESPSVTLACLAA